jgi:hypothetical protein
MNKVDLYLLKTTFYFFLLANIIALCFPGSKPFPLMNALALGLSLLMLVLIRLTIVRYAKDFSKSREEVKTLLGEYIEDDKRGKVSFHDYLKRRLQPASSTRPH